MPVYNSEQLSEYGADRENVSEAVPEAVGQAFPAGKSGDQLESLPGTGVPHQCETILFYERLL